MTMIVKTIWTIQVESLFICEYIRPHFFFVAAYYQLFFNALIFDSISIPCLPASICQIYVGVFLSKPILIFTYLFCTFSTSFHLLYPYISVTYIKPVLTIVSIRYSLLFRMFNPALDPTPPVLHLLPFGIYLLGPLHVFKWSPRRELTGQIFETAHKFYFLPIQFPSLCSFLSTLPSKERIINLPTFLLGLPFLPQTLLRHLRIVTYAPSNSQFTDPSKFFPSQISSMSSIAILNSVGLSGHPCFTPFVISISFVSSSSVFILVVIFLYIPFISLPFYLLFLSYLVYLSLFFCWFCQWFCQKRLWSL